MSFDSVKFSDGAAYEQGMGGWSRLAGEIFLDWLAADQNQRWIDVGCGNGAFTDLIANRCNPAAVEGIDPSDGQLEFARTRAIPGNVAFSQGDALALPFDDSSFDIATMALVIYFVPDPAKGVAEMSRVVRQGGTVAAYAWDMLRHGQPFEAIFDELRALGVDPGGPPSAAISRMEAMLELWTRAGYDAVETKEIVVQRSFEDFDEFWSGIAGGPIGLQVSKLSASDLEVLKNRVRERLPADADGRICFSSKANAAKGVVPI